jgi:hypothetical protein
VVRQVPTITQAQLFPIQVVVVVVVQQSVEQAEQTQPMVAQAQHRLPQQPIVVAVAAAIVR